MTFDKDLLLQTHPALHKLNDRHGVIVGFDDVATHAPKSTSRVFTSSKMSPHVYHLVNMMCRFIISISYPVNRQGGEGKEGTKTRPPL
jgi:hypothetical protein